MSSPCLEGFTERRRRDMQLHRGLVASEKQPLHMFEFMPIRAAPSETSADMLPPLAVLATQNKRSPRNERLNAQCAEAPEDFLHGGIGAAT